MVPAALLLDQELTSSAKLVWMLCRVHGEASPPPASRLAAQSGLTTDIIRAALARAAAIPTPTGPIVALPGALLTDPKLIPAAKALYGILQSQNGEFTYPRLSLLTGTGPNTLKRAVAALVHAEWLEAEQRSRLAPVRFTLRNPILARQQMEVELPVVVIHSEDLTPAAMRAKIGRLLPLRDLTDHEPLIAFLERRARRYREDGAL